MLKTFFNFEFSFSRVFIDVLVFVNFPKKYPFLISNFKYPFLVIFGNENFDDFLELNS